MRKILIVAIFVLMPVIANAGGAILLLDAATATAGTNTTQLATTAFVATAIAGRLPIITDGTIDANSTALQDNTLYLSSNTQALTNGATSAWAWALLNIRVGSWTRIQYLFQGDGIRYRTVDGTFTGATWTVQ